MSLEVELKDFVRFQRLLPAKFLKQEKGSSQPAKLSKKQEKKIQKHKIALPQNNNNGDQKEYSISELKDKLHSKIQEVRQKNASKKDKKVTKKIQKNKDNNQKQNQGNKKQGNQQQKKQDNKNNNKSNKGVAGFDGKRKNKFKH